jgi:hypothetical protein
MPVMLVMCGTFFQISLHFGSGVTLSSYLYFESFPSCSHNHGLFFFPLYFAFGQ